MRLGEIPGLGFKELDNLAAASFFDHRSLDDVHFEIFDSRDVQTVRFRGAGVHRVGVFVLKHLLEESRVCGTSVCVELDEGLDVA